MIVRFLTNTEPISTIGLTTKIVSSVIKRADDPKDEPEPLETFNINDYDCCYTELALAELDPDKDRNWKSDKSSFLFNKSIPADTIELKIFKCENEEEVEKAILNDNTYGEYRAAAYFGDDLRVGFILEWKAILAAFGPGKYFLRANREIINRASEVETHKFNLQPYDEFIANKTIRIQTISKGIIEGGIDDTGDGVEWEQMVRIRGKFWNPQPTFETDNYQDTNRNINQIQDEITTTYDLELENIPRQIAKPLIYDKLLANQIFITDYNLFNYDRYRDYEVYPTEITDSKFYSRTGNGVFSFKFTDKQQNIIKRNFL